jgi:hypothetical protein
VTGAESDRDGANALEGNSPSESRDRTPDQLSPPGHLATTSGQAMGSQYAVQLELTEEGWATMLKAIDQLLVA